MRTPGPVKFGLQPGGYAVVTLHRPSNVDDAGTLGNLVQQMLAMSARLPLLFSVHPRTRKKLEEFGLWPALQSAAGIRLTEPLGYVEFMALVRAARAVVTDSGGVQEESTYLGIPCLTLRENTERPITVTQGSNRLVAAQRPLAEPRRGARRAVADGLAPGWLGRAGGAAAVSPRYAGGTRSKGVS